MGDCVKYNCDNKCYYCGAEAPEEADYYVHTMYYIHKRTSLPLGYKYSAKKVTIPRCRECHQRHEHFWARWPSLCVFVGVFVLLYWILCERIDAWWEYLTLVFFCGLFALIAAGTLYKVLELGFFEKVAGIPAEEHIDRYPLVQEMLRGGWVKSRPDPGSMPETGEERGKSQDT
jgi:hypothetical protein